MKWQKKGLIYKASEHSEWWHSHTMAPSAVLINISTIRVFLGCWDKQGISRIGFIDLDSQNPKKILNISDKPVLGIGDPGTFDDNGVFPGHASVFWDKIYLYYTGFQLGEKVRFFNFGGLACGEINDLEYHRVSQAPVLDRSDEGLHVRAGNSVIFEDNRFKSVYSAGTGWHYVGGKMRQTYDIYYQETIDGISFAKKGKLILKSDPTIEHGLGRPQLIKMRNKYYLFYTRRFLDMKYFLGASVSDDLENWSSLEMIGLEHSENGWDSEMVYFPSVLNVDDKTYLFYCGNEFGKTGFGFAELIEW